MFSIARAKTAVFAPKRGGNCYTLDIPEYLTRTFSLNDITSLQYQNTSKPAYVIVIEDNKDFRTFL